MNTEEDTEVEEQEEEEEEEEQYGLEQANEDDATDEYYDQEESVYYDVDHAAHNNLIGANGHAETGQGQGQDALTEMELKMAAARMNKQTDDAELMRQYEEKRQQERSQLEDEIAELKANRERRRAERAEEEEKRAVMLRIAEDRRRIEEEEKRHLQEESKRKRDERKHRMAQMAGGLATVIPRSQDGTGKPNFVVPNKKNGDVDRESSITKARMDRWMTDDQLKAAKESHMSTYRKPLNLEEESLDSLKEKIRALHKRVCSLEGLRYDLEDRSKTQDYDLKELKTRQRQMLRNEARRKGLDPEEYANAKHPPLVSVISRFERQVDRRDFGERRNLFATGKFGSMEEEDEPELYHGGARPPADWGCPSRAEDIVYVRKLMSENKPKWQELDSEGQIIY